ncbi:amidohydrolase/deacetylase family metallohydrolase [Daejeonella sp.]|uniref:amidohydrolase/deacetylase family metallohydrolase n=1 Tax=Daejeonella sp. TaxID=2805397 RepID=UPI002C0DEBC1|nr:amidohydrolase/deacetylase family metallohydrolase [Daejeonella sp.]HQT22645.1 amidohydrolase/deacetylase family metallohydrolase [Daejeonella sp.]HQT57665.1 amidohydrolase/deacetylase family metallohydrolase [Daejeonella sp.]
MENNLLQTEEYRFMNFFYFEIRNRVMMSLQRASLILFLVLSPFLSRAQNYDLLLKGGRLIDAKNKVDAKMDVAVKDGKISRVAADIPASAAKKVLDVSGLIVAPGLINIHTHVFAGSNPGFSDGQSSQLPDAFAIRSGITTVVDAGTTGWRTFPEFKAKVIDPSITRVLAWINIFETGFSSGSGFEPDMGTVSVQKTAEAIQKYKDYIVGTRVGHYKGKSWLPFERASEAAKIANTPLFVECHMPQYTLQEQLDHMRPGDIITHSFENVSERMTVVDEQGKVRPFVLDAQKRGVLFDVGHGGAGFWFNQAIPAFNQGLWPNSFGTDEHRTSMNSGMKNMLNVMSKYLNIGMSIPEVIARGSWNAAKSIKREDLGNLSEGSVADIAVLSIINGKFGFVDSGQNRIQGDRKLEAELTVRAGRIVWDLNGLAANTYK